MFDAHDVAHELDVLTAAVAVWAPAPQPGGRGSNR